MHVKSIFFLHYKISFSIVNKIIEYVGNLKYAINKECNSLLCLVLIQYNIESRTIFNKIN